MLTPLTFGSWLGSFWSCPLEVLLRDHLLHRAQVTWLWQPPNDMLLSDWLNDHDTVILMTSRNYPHPTQVLTLHSSNTESLEWVPPHTAVTFWHTTCPLIRPWVLVAMWLWLETCTLPASSDCSALAADRHHSKCNWPNIHMDQVYPILLDIITSSLLTSGPLQNLQKKLKTV